MADATIPELRRLAGDGPDGYVYVKHGSLRAVLDSHDALLALFSMEGATSCLYPVTEREHAAIARARELTGEAD